MPVVGRCQKVISYLDEGYHHLHANTHALLEDAEGAATCLHCCVRFMGMEGTDSTEATTMGRFLLHALESDGVVCEMTRRNCAGDMMALLFNSVHETDRELGGLMEDLAVSFACRSPSTACTPAFLNAFWAIYVESSLRRREALIGVFAAVLSELPEIGELLSVAGPKLLCEFNVFLTDSSATETAKAAVLYVFLKVAHSANVVDVFTHLDGIFQTITKGLSQTAPQSVFCINAVALLNSVCGFPEIVRMLPLCTEGDVSLPKAVSRLLTQKVPHLQKALVTLLCTLCREHGGAGLLAETLLPEYLLECLDADDPDLIISACELLETLHTEGGACVIKLRHAIDSVVQRLFRLLPSGQDAVVVPATKLLSVLLDGLEQKGFESGGGVELRGATKGNLVMVVQLVVVGEEGERVAAGRVAMGVAAMGSCVRLRCVDCAELIRTASRAVMEEVEVVAAVISLFDAASESLHTLHTLDSPEVHTVYTHALHLARHPHSDRSMICSLLSLSHNVLTPSLLPTFAPYLLSVLLTHTSNLPEIAAQIAARCLQKLMSVSGSSSWEEETVLEVTVGGVVNGLGGDEKSVERACDVIAFDFEHSEEINFNPAEILRIVAQSHATPEHIVRLSTVVHKRCGIVHGEGDRHFIRNCLRSFASNEDTPAPAVLTWAVRLFGIDADVLSIVLKVPATKPYLDAMVTATYATADLTLALLRHQADAGLTETQRLRLLPWCLECVGALKGADDEVLYSALSVLKVVADSGSTMVVKIVRTLLDLLPKPEKSVEMHSAVRSLCVWAVALLERTLQRVVEGGSERTLCELAAQCIHLLDVSGVCACGGVPLCPSLLASCFSHMTLRKNVVTTHLSTRAPLLRMLALLLGGEGAGHDGCPRVCFVSLTVGLHGFTREEKENVFVAVARLLATDSLLNLDACLFLHAALQCWAVGPDSVRTAILHATEALPKAMLATLATHPALLWMKSCGGEEVVSNLNQLLLKIGSPYCP